MTNSSQCCILSVILTLSTIIYGQIFHLEHQELETGEKTKGQCFDSYTKSLSFTIHFRIKNNTLNTQQNHSRLLQEVRCKHFGRTAQNTVLHICCLSHHHFHISFLSSYVLSGFPFLGFYFKSLSQLHRFLCQFTLSSVERRTATCKSNRKTGKSAGAH